MSAKSPRRLQRLFLALILTALGAEAARAQMQTVRTGIVEAAPMRTHERVIGSLRARSRATLAALEEGPLLEVRVRIADRVAKGDVIAVTDTRRLEAQRAQRVAELAAGRAAVASREAELVNAREDFESMSAAAERNAISQRQLRQARTAVAVAEAMVEAAKREADAIEAGIALLDVRIADGVLRAPFDARVTERMAEPGEWLQAGEPIAELVSTGAIEAWFQTPERLYATARQLEGPLEIEIGATGERLESDQVVVRADVHERARTFSLIALLDDRDGAFGPGMSATAWLPTGEEQERISLPSDAVVRRVGSTFVYRVVTGKDGAVAAEMVPVVIDFERGGRTIVAAGTLLRGGDAVVTEGNERLIPGMPIVVVGKAEKRDERAGAAPAGSGR